MRNNILIKFTTYITKSITSKNNFTKISTTFIEPFKKDPKNPNYTISEDIDDLYKILFDFIKEIKRILNQ